MAKVVKKNSVKKKKEIKKNLKAEEKIEVAEKVKPEKVLLEDDEPSWYHYAIILLVFFGIIAGIYYGYEYYDMKKHEDLSKYEPSSESFIYPYVSNNITFNIEFQNDFNFIKKQNIPIEVKKEDIWSSVNVTFAFYTYNGTDNRYVTTTSVKFMKLLKYVYGMNFNESESFKMINESNCSTSTLNSKVIVFNPYTTRNGVFYNKENGCIEVFSRTPKEMVLVGDTLLYDLIVKKS